MYQGDPSPTQLTPTFLARARAFSKTASLLNIALGCFVLAVWMLHIELPNSVLPGLATMKVNTALLFMACGASLWLQLKGGHQRMAQLLAAMVVLISLLTLGEYIFHKNFGIDQFLIKDTNPGAAFPGRSSSGTALCFLLTGLTLLRLHRKPLHWVEEAPEVLVLIPALTALIGYLYDADALYQVRFYSSMALHTSAGLILIALGILFAHPESGLSSLVLAETAGGRVLRRMLPASVLLPLFLGLVGLLGERAGLYLPDFTLAFVTTMLVVVQIMFVWSNALELNRIDLANSRIHENLQASEFRFRTIIEGMAEGFQLVGPDWRHIYVNDAAVQNTRLRREQLVGHTLQECFPGIENLAMFESFRATMQDRVPRQITTKYTFSDGTSGWYDIRAERVEEGIFILSTDITQRHQAEQGLLEREMKLAKILDILPVGVTILDNDRRIIFNNPAVSKVLHMSEEELRAGVYNERTYLRADGTPMPPEEIPSMRAVAEGIEIRDMEIGMMKENGNTLWVNVTAVPVDFSDWKVLTLTADITDRKRAEQRLEETYVRQQNILDSMFAFVGILSMDGLLLNANRTPLEASGLRPEQVLGKPFASILTSFSDPEMYQELIDKAIQRAASGEIARLDLPVTLPDDQTFIVDTNFSPLRDSTGKIDQVIAFGVNVTDRKRAEQALLESETRFSKIFHASPIGINLFRLSDGQAIEVNESFTDMVGYSREEIIGRTSAELDLFVDPAARAVWMEKLRNGKTVRDQETQIRRKSGEIRDVLSTYDIVELNGEPTTLVMAFDITERRQAAKRLEKINVELEKRVAQRTAELAEANEQLRQLAILDELTNLYNRRGFLLLAEQQFLLAKRSKRNILIFYADLDDLKQINDTLGHKAGDEALVQTAQAINKTFRASDIKARLGGDEFVILAIEAYGNDMQDLLARLHGKLTGYDLSMSVGVISFDPHHDTPMEELLVRADQAMYVEKQKKSGRRAGS